ncbi:hypothetical protein B0O80DRAFT_484881 [Mortierella sp. GBAus27b]|nr:hypothetical protein B0O80DRAFT_484881 [Mortierella sp. GBAus27b]
MRPPDLFTNWLPERQGRGRRLAKWLDIRQSTNRVYEMLYLFAQPTLEATLNDTFALYDDTIPLVHLDHVGPNIATMVTSHLVIGFILSPGICPYTIVQTGNPLHRKYTGIFNCIMTITQEEGVSAPCGEESTCSQPWSTTR